MQDTVFVGGALHGFEKIVVEGKRAAFFFDPAQGLAYGTVTFTARPLKITVFCSSDRVNRLPETPISAGPLALQGAFDSADANNATAENNSYHWVKVTGQAPFAPRDGAGALVYQQKMWLIGGWNPRDKKKISTNL